jgi:type I restriction enzyme S subunit
LGIFLNGQDLKFFITGSAQPKLTQAALNRIFVPLPPYSEQLRIVAEVERRLSVVEELEAVVNTSLQRATGLRQSILQRAFEGTLIP